jgi:hypothetical protein
MGSTTTLTTRLLLPAEVRHGTITNPLLWFLSELSTVPNTHPTKRLVCILFQPCSIPQPPVRTRAHEQMSRRHLSLSVHPRIQRGAIVRPRVTPVSEGVAPLVTLDTRLLTLARTVRVLPCGWALVGWLVGWMKDLVSYG